MRSSGRVFGHSSAAHRVGCHWRQLECECGIDVTPAVSSADRCADRCQFRRGEDLGAVRGALGEEMQHGCLTGEAQRWRLVLRGSSWRWSRTHCRNGRRRADATEDAQGDV